MTDHKRMHQQLLDMLGAKDQVDAARIIAGFQAAHLSTQAMVQVSDAELLKVSRETGLREYLHGVGPVDAQAILRRYVDAVAARRTHAAQSSGNSGELADVAECNRCGATSDAQAETMCIPDGDSCPGCEKPLADQWKAERAAVPDGWVPVPRVPAIEQLEAIMSSYWGDGWDNVGDMRDARMVDAQNMYDAMLTAAPQPPEGARVVDERDVLGYFSADPAEGEFSRHETLEAARQAAEGLLESAGDEAADWGWADDPPQICYGVVLGGCEVESRDVAPEGSDFEELVNYRVFGPGVAPTLAGKDGA